MNSGLVGGLGVQPLKSQRIFNTPYGSTIVSPVPANNIRPDLIPASYNRHVDYGAFQVRDNTGQRALVLSHDNANGRTLFFQSKTTPTGRIQWNGSDRSSAILFNTFISADVPFNAGYFSSTTIGAARYVASNGNGTLTHFALCDDGQTTADVLALRNTTNAQAYRVYNTFTSLTNYERFTIDWQTSPNTCVIGTSAAGAGSVRGMDFRIGSTTLMSMASAGNVVTIGSTAGGYLHFNSNTITGGFGGSIAGRPVLSMAGGQGSSIIATVGGIVGTDCFGVSPAGGQANTNMLGVFSSNTSYTITIGAARKDFNGAYTGNGHNTSIIGGRASSQSTGGSGGTLALSGGDAAGSGNNNGGNVVITGGAATGTGTRGNVLITNLPTTSAGLPTGALWNDAGTLKIV